LSALLGHCTHKFGPADNDTEDLWDGDIPVRHQGYLTDLLGDRALATIEQFTRAEPTSRIAIRTFMRAR